MGVESKFYILPDNSGYRPDAGDVCALVRALRAARFLCDPSAAGFDRSVLRPSREAQADYEGFDWRRQREWQCGSMSALEAALTELGDRDVLIQWSIGDLQRSGLQYPLTVIPDIEGVYYDTEIHLAPHTVYSTSELIDPFDEIRCPCGERIEELPNEDAPGFDPFYSSRLPNQCPACDASMNYAALPLTMRDWRTGDASTIVGGIVYRFAVVVDCGKCWPEQEATVSREFLDVIEEVLPVKTRVVRDFY